MTLSEYDLHLMTLTIAGEARGEDWDGKIAVGHVIMKRFNNPGWWSRNRDDIPDDTIAAVCADPYQFSCLNANDPNVRYLILLPPTAPVYLECRAAALAVLTGRAPNPTGGATHYFKTGTPEPKWAAGRQPTAIVGVHRFYDVGLSG